MRRRWFGVFLTLLVSISSLVFALSTPTPAYAASGVGCPQGPAGPASPTANYPCPEGGAVINGVYTAENKLGCPGMPMAPVTNSYDCLNGGKVVSGEYVAPGGTAQNTPLDTTAPAKCDGGANFTWVVCGVIEFFVGDNGVVNAIRDNAIVPFMEAKPLTKDTPIYKIWSSLRNVASVFFILVFFLVIIGTALGFDNYTIKKIMPHLVAGAILVPFSWELCAFVIDLGNVVGQGLPALMDPLIGHVTIDIKENWTNFFGLGAAAVTGGFALYAGAAAMGLAGVISLVIALAGVFLTLIMRQILITLLVVLSPFAILAWILPNTEKWFKTWWQNLFKLVMMYPIIMLLFEAGRIFASVAGSTVTGSTTAQGVADNVAPLVQILALVMPLFLVPFAFKFAGSGLSMANGAVGRFTGMAEKKWGKSSDRAKEAAENRARNNLARAKEWEGKGNTRLGKVAFGAASRAAYRRAGFAKSLPGIKNVSADLKREGAVGKASSDFATWNANDKNKKEGIPGETMKERIAAETVLAARKKADDRASRKGVLQDQQENTPETIAAGNRALFAANMDATRRKQNAERTTAEGTAEAIAENYQSAETLREYNKDHGYIHAAEERQKIDGTLDMDHRRNQQIKEEYEAANPGKKISLHDAHQMRMNNIKGAANIAGGNDVLKKDIDSAATVLASKNATDTEIERALHDGRGPISEFEAQNARIKTAVASGISQGRAQKLKAEAGDQAYMDVEREAGGQQKASEIIAGEKLLQRQKLVNARTAAQGAIDADAADHKTTADLLETSRHKSAKDFAEEIGTANAQRQAMETEAEMDHLTPGTAAAYKAAAARTVEATSSVRGRNLTEAIGKEQGVRVADAKELERAQEEYRKANPGAAPGSIPTAQSVRSERLLNAAYDAQGGSASQTTAAYADIAGGANEYNKDVEKYQAENPGTSLAQAQNAVTSRNLSNISTTGRVAAQNKYRKENSDRQGNVDQYEARISAAADTIQAASPAMTREQAEVAAVDAVDTQDLDAIGIAARQSGALSGRKLTDDAHGTVAGIESQAQLDTEQRIELEAKNAGVALSPDMVKQRAAAELATKTTPQRIAEVQATNVRTASISNRTAAAERQIADMKKAPGLNTAHEAAIQQAILEDRGNKASLEARSKGFDEQQTSKYVADARNQAMTEMANGTISREEQEHTALVAVAAAAEDKATRDAGTTDALVAATNQAINDPTRLTAEQQLEVDTENAIGSLAAKRGIDEAIWRETRPGAKLNRSFATAKEAQGRVQRDKILDDRVAQAKQGKVQIFKYKKDPSRPGDFFVPELDAAGNKILIEEGTIKDINTSDDALASMKDEGVQLLLDGQIDRGIALLDKVGSMAKGKEMLRDVQYQHFGRDDYNPFDPNKSVFGDRTATIWNKIVANVPFDGSPDLHGPMIGVFKTADPAKLLKMDWRTQKRYFDFLSRRHEKHLLHVADPAANPEDDKEGEKLYNAMSNTIASIFDEKNQASIEKLNDDSVEQMARYTFQLDPSGRIIPGAYTDAGNRLATGNPKQQKALDLLRERYDTLHS